MTQDELDSFPRLAEWQMIAKISRMRRSDLKLINRTYGINECPFRCIPKLAVCRRHPKSKCQCPVWGRQTPCPHIIERPWYLPTKVQVLLYQLLSPEKYLGPGERPIIPPPKRRRREPKGLPSPISRRIILDGDI